jgi:hypothetical protein
MVAVMVQAAVVMVPVVWGLVEVVEADEAQRDLQGACEVVESRATGEETEAAKVGAKAVEKVLVVGG